MSSREPCPTPWKQAHAQRGLARDEATRGKKKRGARLVAYHCVCGAWHVANERGATAARRRYRRAR